MTQLQLQQWWQKYGLAFLVAAICVIFGAIRLPSGAIPSGAYVDFLHVIVLALLGILNFVLFIIDSDLLALLLLAIIGFFIGWFVKSGWKRSQRSRQMILLAFLVNVVVGSLVFFFFAAGTSLQNWQ